MAALSTKHKIRVYTGGTLGSFRGTAGTAIIETGEAEGNEGGRTFVSGVKPLIDTTTVTVALGTRNDQTSSATYTSEVTPTTRTGMADFRSDARYHRVRLTITGSFSAAMGIEPMARPSGKA